MGFALIKAIQHTGKAYTGSNYRRVEGTDGKYKYIPITTNAKKTVQTTQEKHPLLGKQLQIKGVGKVTVTAVDEASNQAIITNEAGKRGKVALNKLQKPKKNEEYKGDSHKDPALEKFILDQIGKDFGEDMPKRGKFLGGGGEGGAWVLASDPKKVLKVWIDKDMGEEEVDRLKTSEVKMHDSGVSENGIAWVVTERLKTFPDSWEDRVKDIYAIAKGLKPQRDFSALEKEVYRAAKVAVQKKYADFNVGNIGVDSTGKVIQFDL